MVSRCTVCETKTIPMTMHSIHMGSNKLKCPAGYNPIHFGYGYLGVFSQQTQKPLQQQFSSSGSCLTNLIPKSTLECSVDGCTATDSSKSIWLEMVSITHYYKVNYIYFIKNSETGNEVAECAVCLAY